MEAKLGGAENSGSLVRFALSRVALEDKLEVAAGTEYRFLFTIKQQPLLQNNTFMCRCISGHHARCWSVLTKT